MCGIAVVVSGIRIEFSCVPSDSACPSSNRDRVPFSVDDLKLALSRRGPDSLGEKEVLLKPKVSVHEREIVSVFETKEAGIRKGVCLNQNGESAFCAYGESLKLENGSSVQAPSAELQFIGATLQLRGTNPISQPLMRSSGNILVYNGEIFGGILVGTDDNDAEVLMDSLEKCSSCKSIGEEEKNSIPDILSAIKGPWAMSYWQESSKTLWFGRDAFGRRSLLVHWPTAEDRHFLLSSVSPTSSALENSGSDVENGDNYLREELPCGIYSICLGVSKSDASLVGEVHKHEWKNTVLKELIEWERISVEPSPKDLAFSQPRNLGREYDSHASSSGLAQTVLNVLRESVMRRTSLHRIFQGEKELAPVAVLFSGGLDSMILAALLDQCLDPKYEIDLLNVSFDGQFAPDRISAKAGVKELGKVAPLRRWKLVEIDADLAELTSETKHVMTLITPANTYMDLNIGIALWLAAGGDGWVNEGINNKTSGDSQRVKYKSNARILLVGAGADEQCAGYGRHKTKYRNGSWLGLHREMKLDMQRIWKRNLGRDDRCIADTGKEARFPFLDEDVIKTLLDLPLWNIADLDQPSGTGDKKILREVARLLGLDKVATLSKRAIQFGSRIARESNRKNFGSNRAANQASAGSAVIQAPPSSG